MQQEWHNHLSLHVGNPDEETSLHASPLQQNLAPVVRQRVCKMAHPLNCTVWNDQIIRKVSKYGQVAEFGAPIYLRRSSAVSASEICDDMSPSIKTKFQVKKRSKVDHEVVMISWLVTPTTWPMNGVWRFDHRVRESPRKKTGDLTIANQSMVKNGHQANGLMYDLS